MSKTDNNYVPWRPALTPERSLSYRPPYGYVQKLKVLIVLTILMMMMTVVIIKKINQKNSHNKSKVLKIFHPFIFHSQIVQLHTILVSVDISIECFNQL